MHQKVLKWLTFTLICCLLAGTSALISYFVFIGSKPVNEEIEKKKVFEEAFSGTNTKKEELETEKEGERINFIIAGIDVSSCEAILLSSFNTKKRKMDIFVIPRNTYYKLTGGNSTKIDKLGDVYQVKGVGGLEAAVNDLVKELNSDFYVIVDYNGFQNIINTMGGVPVSIRQRMHYEDPYGKPPLIINFAPGNYTLNGADSLKYLRYINGTNDTLIRGEAGRIQALQQFLEASIQKAYTLKLPALINTGYKYVKTDIAAGDLASLTTAVVGMKRDDIRIHKMPGYYTENQFYVIDNEKLSEEINAIFNEN